MIVIPREGGPRGIQHGFEATQRLLALRPRIDAIFAFNDPQAIGAIEATLAAGRRVPQDVAIIGCGDLPLGRTLHVPLSTVDQNTKELGEKSAKAVLALLRKGDKAAPVRRQMLKPRLIVRQSSDRSASKKTLAG
jgi:LacI family transcriptional regulator